MRYTDENKMTQKTWHETETEIHEGSCEIRINAIGDRTSNGVDKMHKDKCKLEQTANGASFI